MNNSGTIDWWVRVHWSDENLKLAFNVFSFGGVGSQESESTNSFSVETKVLGKRLSNSNVVSIKYELSDWESILVSISTGKSLVSKIKEWEVSLGFNNLRDFLPLGQVWINSGWVVSTGMEENQRLAWGTL